MIMDLKRSCYSTVMRPFKENNYEVPMVWYFAADDAKVFPGHHKFSSLDWERRDGKLFNDSVGEVADAPRPWRNGSMPGELFFEGQKFCGKSEYFRDGAKWEERREISDLPCECGNVTGDPICCPITFQVFGVPFTLKGFFFLDNVFFLEVQFIQINEEALEWICDPTFTGEYLWFRCNGEAFVTGSTYSEGPGFQEVPGLISKVLCHPFRVDISNFEVVGDLGPLPAGFYTGYITRPDPEV